MRLLVVGRLSGQLATAVKMAMAHGAQVNHVERADQATEQLRRGQGADLLMVDYRLDIASLISANENERITVPVVAFGVDADAREAAAAIKAGAKEFIPLPPDADLIAAVLSAVADDEKPMISADPSMKAVIGLADQVARSEASILITGESGVGKEVMARYLHQNSRRAEKPFISVNCAAIPDNLLESELFGHERGAFTGAVARRIGKFEEADGGTLLLDEVTEMDARLQAKLLRAIQERVIDRVGGSRPVSVNIRIIATSNRDLNRAVSEGVFREDLLYRLNVVNLRLPSLRERPGDIAVLAEHFVKKYAAANGVAPRPLSPDARRAIVAHRWPGNVRELENAMHRAVLLAVGPEIDADAIRLPDGRPLQTTPGAAPAPQPVAATYDTGVAGRAAQAADAVTRSFVGQTVAAMEKTLILDTLSHCLGNRTHAANILGISIRTLRNKLNEYADEGTPIPAPQSGVAAPWLRGLSVIRGADRRGVLAGLVLLGLGACRRAPERRESSVEPPQAPAVLDLSDLERTHGGRIGLAAAERRAVAWRGDERFNYCSTFKLFLAACVLERASREQETLDRPIPITAGDILPHWPTTEGAVGRTLTISELAQATVELSDNAAANILIREIGGLDVLRAWYRAMGDETTSIDRLEPALNVADGTKDTTTANQTVQNLNWMEETYRPFNFQSPHRPLWDWMIHSPTGRGRIRAGVPNGWTVAHKTSTGGTGQTNDIGYAYAAAELPVRIAVYYDAPESLPLERREAVVAEASRRALAALGHGRPDDAPRRRKGRHVTDAPILMKDGYARPTRQDVTGWLMRGEVLMAVGVIGVIMLLIVPVPKLLLDLLLAISIVSSVLILMTAVMMKRPLDFAIFPTVLLVTTLYRLGLNLASTRLILTHGQEGHDAAGQVINAFGELMMGGNFIIGVIIFAIVLVVNFVVITKGSTRIAEVSARFTLDSMPGKQMAIDADLSAGLIDEATAKLRRKELEQESTFFGAMDGASKFVRGDAVAGLIITFINVIGGILIGVMQHGMPIGDAANTYTQLTIGDGLVTQIPAIIVSIAAGFLVSKAGVEGTADKALVSRSATNPVSLGVVSGAAGLIGLIPGMPILPFAALALGSGFMAWRLGRARLKPEPTEAEIAAAQAKPREDVEEPISAALSIDEVKIELGYSLLALINDLEGRRLTDQIRALRRSLAQEYGFVMPQVRILDNMRLPTQGYAIRIKEMEAGAGEVRLGCLMTMDPAGRQVELPGEHMKEPAFGLPATWIEESLREEATFRGYTIVDPSTVLTTHLTEILKENMADLLSYAEVQKLLKEVGSEEKKLVEELIPSVVTVTTLQRVLQSLLRERVSIRDLPAILEGLAEAAPHTTSVSTLVEHVRGRLARQLCWQHQGHDGALPIVTLSPDWEAAFAEALVGQGEDRQLAMAPSRLQDFIRSTRDTFERIAMSGENAVLLTGPMIRPYVRSIIERFRGQTVVMSQNEVHPKARLRTLGQV